MKVSRMSLHNNVMRSQFYNSFKTPELEKYTVNLNEEAPKLVDHICSLDDGSAKRFWQTFKEGVDNLDPATRNTFLSNPTTQRIVGGAAFGGAGGAAGALGALSISEIAEAVSNPAGFAIGVTAFGLVAGALAGTIVDYLSQPQPLGTERHGKFIYESPEWTRIAFGKFHVEMEIGSKP